MAMLTCKSLPHESETVDSQIGVEESKYRVTGDPPHLQVGKGSRGLLLKLRDPSISQERLVGWS